MKEQMNRDSRKNQQKLEGVKNPKKRKQSKKSKFQSTKEGICLHPL